MERISPASTPTAPMAAPRRPSSPASGGRQIWAGKPQVMVTGPTDEAWDLAFIAEYPNSGAFLEMVRDPDYRELVKHRSAGVADSRLLRLAPITPGEGFGE